MADTAEGGSPLIREDIVAGSGEEIEQFLVKMGFSSHEHLYLLTILTLRALEGYKVALGDWFDTLELEAERLGLLKQGAAPAPAPEPAPTAPAPEPAPAAPPDPTPK